MTTLAAMPGQAPPNIQVFDPQADYVVRERRLPHWSQPTTITFITWRTWDSIPQRVVSQWLEERDAHLRGHAIDPAAPNWQAQLDGLSDHLRRKSTRQLSDRWNEHLDELYGQCVLKQPELAQIVAASLRHFDGDRYELRDFVVMPNHVHLLVAFPDEDSLLRQCDSWKHFTARQINQQIGRTGRLWQQDGFDHLVRSVDQFDYLRRYIADNPQRAGLKPGEYLHFSKPLQ
jgi:putative transposase